MLITTTFTSSKPSQPLPSSKHLIRDDGPSSSKHSTSTSTPTAASHSIEEASITAARTAIASTRNNPATYLTPSEATTLNLFLRSSRSTAPLLIADIQGTLDPLTGEASPPAVRRGRIRTSSPSLNGASSSFQIQCCIIDAYPFEKCEIVATIVKKNAIYRQARNDCTSNSKGKGRAMNVDDDPSRGEIQLIFYELDDESGATITCCVNPSRVYAKELSESRQQVQGHAPSMRNVYDEECRTTDSESTDDEMRNNENRHADGAAETDPNATPRPAAKPKSDPRLWIYRYKSPPRQASTTSRLSSSSPRSPTYHIPLYNEGTVLRVTGKIFLNTARGNERQIEASTVEAVYEPEYRIGRRNVKETGNKYAEWHHNLKCKRKRMEFKDREKVRELIGFTSNQSKPARDGEQSMASVGDVTILDVTLPSFNNTVNTTSASLISSTSMLDASHLPDNSTRDSSFSQASTSSTAHARATTASTKRKRAKLPSCSTLYKQKIPITKEIFSLYVHQFFRDLNIGKHQRGKRNVKATMDELKEDKNLKWLAEISARSEARRIAATSTSTNMKTNSDQTPKANMKRHYPSSVSVIESSIILPASSPSHHHSTRSSPKHNHDIVMTDTTNQLSSASASPSSSMLPDTQERKVKLKAEVVNRIRNDLFRNTILKLVKDGTIVVFPADLSASTAKSHSTGIAKQKCAMCKEQKRKEMERIPPIMTMDGIPLREYDSFEGESEQRKDDGSKCPHTSSIPKAAQHTEETYALMTMELVMPLVEKVLSRMDTSLGVDVDYLVGAVRRSDDMFRFVSRETVKGCLEFSGGRSN